jgi:DegV family protein with EDD domain
MRKQEIAVVTDSVANIPQNLIDKYNIEVIPILIRYDDKFYREGIDITAEEVYKKVEDGVLPGASQVTFGVFLNTYKRLLKNFKSIISIHLTQKLSGTLSSAISAANIISLEKIKVFNSETVLMAQGFQVLEAARAAKAGEKIEDILKKLHYVRNNTKEYIAIEKIKYLLKSAGKRIPRVQILVPILSKLNIKPVLALNKGNVVVSKIMRSRKKSLNELVNKISSDFGKKTKLRIAIMHALVKEEAIKLKNIFLEEFNCAEIIIVEANPIIGAFTGPGMIGVAACPSEIPTEILK